MSINNKDYIKIEISAFQTEDNETKVYVDILTATKCISKSNLMPKTIKEEFLGGNLERKISTMLNDAINPTKVALEMEKETK